MKIAKSYALPNVQEIFGSAFNGFDCGAVAANIDVSTGTECIETLEEININEIYQMVLSTFYNYVLYY